MKTNMKKANLVTVANELISKGNDLVKSSDAIGEVGKTLISQGEILMNVYKKTSVAEAVNDAVLNNDKPESHVRGAKVKLIADMDCFSESVKTALASHGLVKIADLRKMSKKNVRTSFANVTGALSELGSFLNYNFDSAKDSTVSEVDKTNSSEVTHIKGKRGRTQQLVKDLDIFSSNLKKAFEKEGIHSTTDLRAISKPLLREKFNGIENGLKEIGEFLKYDFNSVKSVTVKNETTIETATKPRGRSPLLLAEMDIFSKPLKAAFEENGLKTATDLRKMSRVDMREKFSGIRNGLKQLGTYLNYDFNKSVKADSTPKETISSDKKVVQSKRRHSIKGMSLTEKQKESAIAEGFKYAEDFLSASEAELMRIKGVGEKNVSRVIEAARSLVG